MPRVHATISHIINHPKDNRQFGFAVGDDGEEYFIPRSTIMEEGLSYSRHVGCGVTGYVRDNPNEIEGRRNLRHFIGPFRFD